MRKVTLVTFALAATLAIAGAGFAGESEPAAQPAPEAGSESADKGGCMPGGGCCGACQQAATNGKESGGEEKAPAMDPENCPCKQKQKQKAM